MHLGPQTLAAFVDELQQIKIAAELSTEAARQNGSSAERTKVYSAVAKKYPELANRSSVGAIKKQAMPLSAFQTVAKGAAPAAKGMLHAATSPGLVQNELKGAKSLLPGGAGPLKLWK